MKIAYIILTCEHNIDLRVKYQKQTFLQTRHITGSVNCNIDYYCISSKMGNDTSNIYGWNTSDQYKDLTYKYLAFITNMNIPQYNWYFFIDDDTFVFPNRLVDYLSKYNSSDNYYIGNLLTIHKHPKLIFDPISYMSGGAGFLLSNPLYSRLKTYLLETENIDKEPLFKIADVTMSIWISDITSDITSPVNIIDCKLFGPSIHQTENELKTNITFHNVNKKNTYLFYETIRIGKVIENKSFKKMNFTFI